MRARGSQRGARGEPKGAKGEPKRAKGEAKGAKKRPTLMKRWNLVPSLSFT